VRWKVKHNAISNPSGGAAGAPPTAPTGLLVPPQDVAALGDELLGLAAIDEPTPPPVDGEPSDGPQANVSAIVRGTSGTPIWKEPLVVLARPLDAAMQWFARRFGEVPSGWATSLVVHLVLLIALALIVPAVTRPGDGLKLIVATNEGDSLDSDLLSAATPGVDSTDVAVDAPKFGQLSTTTTPSLANLPKIDLAEIFEPEQAADATASSPQTPDSAPKHSGRRFVAGAGLGGRDPGNRPRLVKEGGGTKDSEVAMEAGLIWIANHQKANGGWSFDHRDGACQGRCGNPGTVASTTASTGLAIMAFLGAGYTHREGPFQREMERGLYYLTGRMLSTPHGGDLQEGTMYAQGIATLALCEAYAMTGDQSLRPFAQHAIDFIVYAQNPKTGGWRYFPGQPGDTTVLGWQLMALRSARMAGLNVPEEAIYMATKYLDSVQDGDGQYRGAYYGYQRPERTNFTTNSVGLLCRMYTGWERSHVPLVHGVDAISKHGPSPDDMYFNYQATQVLHHWGGRQWREWNGKLRDHLVRSQRGEGHEYGSWHFDDKHSAQGGRLYNTAMAVMVLQVYYRYLPLYTDKAIASGEAVSTQPRDAGE
jgi:hypothetical protein